jgi:two-component sensor histidine kinase
MADGDANLVMHWVESGGPPVTPSSKSGFGSEVITRIAPRSISGTAEIEYDRNGIRYTLMAPLAILSAKNEEATINYF